MLYCLIDVVPSSHGTDQTLLFILFYFLLLINLDLLVNCRVVLGISSPTDKVPLATVTLETNMGTKLQKHNSSRDPLRESLYLMIFIKCFYLIVEVFYRIKDPNSIFLPM